MSFVAEAPEAHRDAHQHVGRAGRHQQDERRGRPQEPAALDLRPPRRAERADVRTASDRDRRTCRTTRNTSRARHGHRRRPAAQPLVAAALRVNSGRCDAASTATSARTTALLPVEPSSGSRRRCPSRAARPSASSAAGTRVRVPRAEDQQQDAGRRCGQVRGLDDRQRHGLVEQGDAPSGSTRTPALSRISSPARPTMPRDHAARELDPLDGAGSPS